MEKCPLEIAALAIAGKVLFAAGTSEDGNLFAADAPEDRNPKLLAYAIEDGQPLSELPLPAPPAFNGMAVAQSRLYLTLKDGSILCLEPAKGRQ
jgi:outer membrane protein assembly factor BamB